MRPLKEVAQMSDSRDELRQGNERAIPHNAKSSTTSGPTIRIYEQWKEGLKFPRNFIRIPKSYLGRLAWLFIFLSGPDLFSNKSLLAFFLSLILTSFHQWQTFGWSKKSSLTFNCGGCVGWRKHPKWGPTTWLTKKFKTMEPFANFPLATNLCTMERKSMEAQGLATTLSANPVKVHCDREPSAFIVRKERRDMSRNEMHFSSSFLRFLHEKTWRCFSKTDIE